jgi:hypothetical protein
MILGNNPLRLIFWYQFHKVKNYEFFFLILLITTQVFLFSKTGGLANDRKSFQQALQNSLIHFTYKPS